MAKRKSESTKRREAKEILVITDENELPITTGSKVISYLTMGMAEAALERVQAGDPSRRENYKISVFVPQSSRLIFMDGGEK